MHATACSLNYFSKQWSRYSAGVGAGRPSGTQPLDDNRCRARERRLLGGRWNERDGSATIYLASREATRHAEMLITGDTPAHAVAQAACSAERA